MREIILPNNLFLRALVITAIIVSVTEAIMFYVVWSGKTRITPLFVILGIIITMVPLAITAHLAERVDNLFRYALLSVLPSSRSV